VLFFLSTLCVTPLLIAVQVFASELKDEKKYDLHRKKIDDVGAECLVDLLKQSPNLQYLNLAENELTDVGCERLINTILESNKKLHTLILSSNEIGASGAESISKLIAKHPALTALDISCNTNIRSFGTESLARSLEYTSRLKSLNLSWLDMGDFGAGYIAEGLEVNRSLTALDLSSNEITDQGARNIGHSIQKCPRLVHVEVRANQIDSEVQQELKMLLVDNVLLMKERQNEELTFLMGATNKYGSESAINKTLIASPHFDSKILREIWTYL
jgi:Ran GTPase-activating protein (RanGAP) involved in mRNA processing and transport